jgi:replicative DNA helicase
MSEQEVYMNVQSEYLFVGSLYKNPDQYLMYGESIRSSYDFGDDATKFFYDMFELMYNTFSQDFSERSINTFATMDTVRYATYNRYQGYKTIKAYMDASNIEDIKNYYNTIKKYSVLREYQRKGFPVSWIVESKKFQTMSANEIVQIVMGLASKVNTVILCEKESVVVNSRMTETQRGYLMTPQMGVPTPWVGYNDMFRGCRAEKVIFDGALSNEGKTRKLMQLAAHIALIEDQSVLIMSNEMSEEDLRSCLLTTVINNEEYKQFHGVDIHKKESEIVLGQYRDDITGEFLKRGEGEDEASYFMRVWNSSEEYRKVTQISEWIDEKRERNLYFKDMGNDYSDQTIEMTIKKHKELYGIRHFMYDTLKGFRTDDWQSVKQTATMLKELMKNEKCFMYAVFQLTDDTVYCDVFNLTSNNIANAKQVKHIADHLVLNMKIHKADYKKYTYIPYDKSLGDGECELNENKIYYGAKIDKNRAADKSKLLLFEVNLDFNTWENVGYLIQKEVTKPTNPNQKNIRR